VEVDGEDGRFVAFAAKEGDAGLIFMLRLERPESDGGVFCAGGEQTGG
jgi:hypothetical protein